MKSISCILFFFLFSYNGFCQEFLNIGFGGSHIDFEKSSDFQYVKIDVDSIWNISHPQKDIINLPTQQSNIGTMAIISDTNKYYSKNLQSSFQFKLYYEMGSSGYSISFNHKYDFEKNKDGGIIETSYDNGQTWTNIIFDTLLSKHYLDVSNIYDTSDTIISANNQPGFTGLQSEFKTVSYYFYPSEIVLYDAMLLRFTIYSDSVNSNNEGWMLDNFSFGGWIEDKIKENISNTEISFYPNPIHNKLVITSNIQIVKIKVININGTIITSAENTNEIDLSNIPKGIYMLLINDSILKKVVVY